MFLLESFTHGDGESEEFAVSVDQLLVAKSNEKINRNSKLLALSVSMCEAFQEEHAAATASRDEEMELLGTVRKMVRRRLEGLGASVVARDDSFDNTAVTSYENDSFAHDGGNQDDALEGFGIDG